ncbi:MAG: hypothetical protein V4739_07000 [Pseudomonadota bacterium]
MPALKYLSFELSESGDDLFTLEAMAATAADQHAAVMSEVQTVLDWAWRHFPDAHGPVDEGMDWHHDLQLTMDGRWHSVALTLTGSRRSPMNVGAPLATRPAEFCGVAGGTSCLSEGRLTLLWKRRHP